MKRDDSGSIFRVFLEFIGVISLPAAVLGIIGAFLGWRASAAYLLTFGILPSFASFDVLGLIVNAWVEIIILLVLLAFGIGSWTLIKRACEHLSFTAINILQISSLLVLIILFYVAVIQATVYYYDIGFLEYAVVRTALLIMWWLFVMFTENLSLEKHEGKKDIVFNLQRFIKWFFAPKLVTVLITVVLVFYYLISFTVFRGTYFARRDVSSDSHLPYITIQSNTDLGIGESILSDTPSGTIHQYTDYRLVGRMNDFIYIMRLNEVDPNTGAVKIHAVPVDMIISMEFRQWYWPSTGQAEDTSIPVPTPGISP